MSGATPRFIVFSPRLALADAKAFLARLEAFVSAADVASVVLRVRPDAGGAVVAALAPLAKARDFALIVQDDLDAASGGGADGVHLSHSPSGLDAALARLKPNRIVGAGGLTTRDDAMVAGEMGADYVLFGAEGDDERAARRAEELVAWWADVMEPPCVGCASSLDQVSAFTHAGADFIALPPALWTDAEAATLIAALRDES